MIKYFSTLAVILFVSTAQAGSLLFQAVLEDTTSAPATPLANQTGLNVSITYRNPGDSCTLATETFSGVSTDANGKFSVTLGTGSIGFTSPAASLEDVFNNSVIYGCYTPGLADTRLIKASVNGGSLVSAINLAMNLGSSPFAVTARVAGTAYAAGTIIGLPACSTGQALKWDGSSWSCVSAGGAASPATAAVLGGVMIPASSELSIDGAGNLTAKTPNTANSLVKLDATAKFPAVDGSQIINLNPVNLSGSVAIAKGGTGRTSFSNNALLITDVSGNIGPGMTCSTAGYIVQWTGTSWICAAPSVGGSVALNSGKIWVGNVSNSAQEVSMSGDATIDNTGNVIVQKIQGYGVSATSPSPGKFMRYGASQWMPADILISDLKSSVTGNFLTGGGCLAGQALVYVSASDQMMCTTITAVSLQGRSVSAATPTMGQLLMWDGSQWAPNSIPIGSGGFIVDGGNSIGATVSIGTNDSQALNIKTNNQNRISIDSTGRVGVGIATPAYPLDIRGVITSGTYQGVATVSADISASQNVGMAVFTKPSGASTDQVSSMHAALDLSMNTNPTFTGAGLQGEIVTTGSQQANSLSGVRGAIDHNSSSTLNFAFGGDFQMSTQKPISFGYGINSYVKADSPAATVGTLAAAANIVNVMNTATVNNAIGIDTGVYAYSSANVYDAKGIQISVTNASGNINYGYGIYLSNINATNKWSIYSADPTAPSYFAGKIGINTISPSTPLHVNGAATIQGNLDMSSQSVTNVAPPANANDAANKQYVDSSNPWMKKVWSAWPSGTGSGTLFISGGGGSPFWSAVAATNGVATYYASNSIPTATANGTNGYYATTITAATANWTAGVLGNNFTYPAAQPTFQAAVYIPGITSVRYTVGLVSSAGVSTSGATGVTGNNLPTTTQSAYFRYSTSAADSSWMCSQCNGVSCNVMNSGVAVTMSASYDLKVAIGSSSVKYYINGSLVCDNFTNVPTGTTALAPIAAVTTLTAITNNIGIYKLFLMSP